MDAAVSSLETATLEEAIPHHTAMSRGKGGEKHTERKLVCQTQAQQVGCLLRGPFHTSGSIQC